jgi:hypothetical protein
MFYLSGLICFVCLEWYVLSIRIKMFCLSGMDRTNHSRQTKHINPDRQNILIRMDRTYHSRQTKHIIPDRQNISIRLSGLRCFVYLDWYVLSVWNDMFFPSGLRCFVYLDWYVLSIWSRLDKTYQSREKKHIIPDKQNISIQIDKTS